MLFVIRYGELTLKSRRVRNRFLGLLEQNLRASLRSRGIFFKLELAWSRAYLETDDPRAQAVLKTCFGVHSFSLARVFEFKELDELVRFGQEFFKDHVRAKRFAVRCKRSGRHGFNSLDVERQLGAALLGFSAGVDLDHPEITCFVEIRGNKCWFFSQKTPGPGGLPLGAGPRLLAMLSGGCDSGVAAWLAMKRGSPVDFLFFNLGGPEHRSRALEAANFLVETWGQAVPSVMIELDFGPVVSAIRHNVRPQYWNMALKWSFYTGARIIAEHDGYPGVITGEAAAQVSTQTVENLLALSGSTGLHPLRPLVFWDKHEITSAAERIGIAPACQASTEFCDLAGSKPVVASSPERLEKALRGLDRDLISQLVQDKTVHQLPVFQRNHLAVQSPPDHAVLVDLREPPAFQAWHPDGAVPMSLDEIELGPDLPRDKTYVFYCGNDLKSARAAELMSRRGYRAFYLKGGVKALMRSGK